jgi:uncharacterized membrane protein
LNDAELLVQQSINGLAAIGVLVFAFRRRSHLLSRMLAALGLASLVVLVASRLSGTLAADYNSSRLFLQCLFILAILEAALIDAVVTRLVSLPRASLVLFGGLSLVLLIAFVGNSGLDAPITGGYPPLILYNDGTDYPAYYATAQDKATVQWLAAAVPRKRVIYADYFGQLRLDQFTSLRKAVFNDVTPRTIDQHAWVFASTSNIVDHLTWGETNSGLVDFVFPASFLNEYYDVVYSTGSTSIFHR